MIILQMERLPLTASSLRVLYSLFNLNVNTLTDFVRMSVDNTQMTHTVSVGPDDHDCAIDKHPDSGVLDK